MAGDFATRMAADAEEHLKDALPPAIVLSDKRWYDLERLSAYRDLFMLMGFLLVVVGIGLLNIPAAFIFAGIGLILLSWLMSR